MNADGLGVGLSREGARDAGMDAAGSGLPTPARNGDLTLANQNTAAALRLVREDVLVAAYEQARAILSGAGLRGGDLIMLSHPIKAPFLEMYDSLTAMANEIESGQWTDDNGSSAGGPA